MKRFESMTPSSPEALERVRAIAERQLTPEEFDSYVRAPMSEDEREEILSSVAWFRKRYPTPGEILPRRGALTHSGRGTCLGKRAGKVAYCPQNCSRL